jgi:hypothetical protein
MVAAMNPPTEERNDASKVVLKQSKPTPVPKHDAPPASPLRLKGKQQVERSMKSEENRCPW